MSALQVVETPEPSADPLVRRLDTMLAELAAAVADCGEVPDTDRIDRIDRLERLERLRATTAALQAAECVRFAQSQVAEQMAADVHPTAIGRGIADQIALACHISPFAGSRRLGSARALWFDLPRTLAQLAAGEISEQVAEMVVSETRHLDGSRRQEVDVQVEEAGIAEMGVKAAAACARRYAYQADPHAYVERGRTERKNRRVGLRAAPDTMSILTGYLPVEQGVACLAALRRHTDGAVAGGDARTRDQIMADTLVERLTGQSGAGDVNVEVQLTMPVQALLDPTDDRVANIPGYGPMPGRLAREIISTSQGRKWWRRLFTGPTGQLVGGDPLRRRFDGWLAQLIMLRDQTCRDPFCDAAIRHLDHITQRRRGGTTTLENGRGVCARGNYVRELPGWRVDTVFSGMSGRPHTVLITTPTGHQYRSRAPRPP